MTSTDYLLPGLPFGGSEITIVRWLKRPGDRVSAGEPLLVVVNDCLEVALPATRDGILERALAAEGAALAVGTPVAVIAPVIATDAASAPDAVLSSTLVTDQGAGRVPGGREATVRASRISPVARRIANTTNIDITGVRGSGISGRIMKADLLALLAGQTPKIKYQPGPPSPIPHPPSPQHPSDHTYVLTAIDVDMERVFDAVARLSPGYARRRLELTCTTCVAWAAVAALPGHPLLNTSWRDDAIVVRRRVHLAAVPRDGSPAVVVRDAQDLNLQGLARGLGGAAAANTIDDRTFTIVDLDEQLWCDPAALARGRSAALGIGVVRAGPQVLSDGGVDRLALRRVALLTLAYDARALDQCHADAFLRDVKRRLEHFAP